MCCESKFHLLLECLNKLLMHLFHDTHRETQTLNLDNEARKHPQVLDQLIFRLYLIKKYNANTMDLQQ